MDGRSAQAPASPPLGSSPLTPAFAGVSIAGELIARSSIAYQAKPMALLIEKNWSFELGGWLA